MKLLLLPLLRALPLLIGVGAVASAARSSGFRPTSFLDPSVAALVLVGPWIVAAATDSLRGAAATARDLLVARLDDLPYARARLLESRLGALGSQSLAFGVLAAAFALIEGMNRIAAMQGQMDAGHWPMLYGGYLLGPFYALLLNLLLYGPARSQLRSRRGMTLEAFTETNGWAP